ncbi:MAG: hypothetical protein KAS32_15460 [Candidatus Peribacteraceae bacterium]|nr:hypothetical protein [Candidatus Peribacteraceae bacterium]
MANGTKTTVLKHWYGMDEVLFGQPAKEALSGEVYEQYLSTKGAFLSNLFEIYKKVGFAPTDEIFESVAKLEEAGIEAGKNSKSRAKSLLENGSVTKMVREEIKNLGSAEGLTESQVAKYVVAKRRNAIAIDSMTMESVLSTKNKADIKDWQGKVLVDAHKTLRDSMLEIAFSF